MTIASRSRTSPSSPYSAHRDAAARGRRRAPRARPRASRPRPRAACATHSPVSRPAARPRRAARRGSRASRRRARPPPRAGGRARGSARSIDHDLGLLAERAAEAEPEVHRHADDERDVGALQPVAARAREEQLVVGGHAAARQAVEEHRDAERLGERAQRLLAVAPVEVRAGHDHRALGVAQQRRRALDVAAAGPAAASRQRRRGAVGLGRLHEHEVEREVDERRARSAGVTAAVSASSTRPGISAVASARGRELGQRAHERHVVDLLQRALAPAHRRRAAAEHEHRRVVLLRRGDRAHAVGHARAGGQRRHAGLAGDLGPALGGERRRLTRGGRRRCRCPPRGSRRRSRTGGRPTA